MKQKFYHYPEVEDISLNACNVFDLDDSFTEKRLEILFELEKSDNEEETLIEFYISLKNQFPMIVLDGLFILSKAIEKHKCIFDYFKKNKNKLEWVKEYYLDFFDDKGNMTQNLAAIISKHPDLFQVIESQFINKLEI